jgi:hypothetical protein
MFTVNHIGNMADLFGGLKNFLANAPANHLEMLAKVLYEYDNQNCALDPADPAFGGILVEVGGLYAEALENCGESKPYEAAFRDERRLNLAMQGAIWARTLGPEEVNVAHQALCASQRPPAEEKVALLDRLDRIEAGAAKGPQAAVKPRRKRKAA